MDQIRIISEPKFVILVFNVRFYIMVINHTDPIYMYTYIAW